MRRRRNRSPAADQNDYSRGDPTPPCALPAVVTDRSYSIERNNHNPMELPVDRRAAGTATSLTVWDKVQSISSAQAGVYAKAHRRTRSTTCG